MYEFKPVTDRIKKMRSIYRDKTMVMDSERGVIVTQVYKENRHVTPMILRAMATLEVCRKMTLRVEDDELFVGNCGKHMFGLGIYPEWQQVGFDRVEESDVWHLEDDGLYHTPKDDLQRMAIAPEDIKIITELAEFWKGGNQITESERAWQPECYEELFNLDVSNYNINDGPIGGAAYGHLTPGYEKILNLGYGGIISQAQEWIDANKKRLMGHDLNKYLFYKSVVMTAQGGAELCRRYSRLCTEKASTETNQARKQELEEMADGLLHISSGTPRTYWEACQAVLIYLLLIRIEAYQPALALGRFDYYTWPFLKKDIDSGRLNYEQAQELTDAFFLKSEFTYVPSPSYSAAAVGIGNTWLHTTIGGCDKTGRDSSNPVTYMVLETLCRLKLHDPTVSLRITDNTPEKLWQLAVETSQRVGGLPLFINDNIVIPTLMEKSRLELEDARNYSMVGCQEPTGSGCHYAACAGTHPNKAGIHAGIVLTVALNNGKNPMNGYQSELHTGYLYEMTSIDEVRRAFAETFRYCHDLFATIQNYSDYIAAYFCPFASISMTTDGCMESGRDVCSGGAKYNSNSDAVTGMATVADSIAAINYMCFDKKLCTTRQLYDAVMANWEGYEPLRQMIINQAPHYGNADPYVDKEFEYCVKAYTDTCDNTYSVRADNFRAGMFGASDHIAQGHRTFATPDGRKTGDALADAASPAQGRDLNGPTAVCCSAVCFDHKQLGNGYALNLRIHPSVFSRPDGTEKLMQFTQTYFEQGGYEIQYNIVNNETLRKAQETPDEYRDLVVRIAGYSAYFVELNKELQNDIISRNANKF